MSEDEEKNLSKKLQEIEGISSVKFLSAKMHTFDDTMSSFGLVALVLIVSAGLLAFVVFVPFMHGLFMIAELTMNQVLWIVGLAAIPTVLIQLFKVVKDLKLAGSGV